MWKAASSISAERKREFNKQVHILHCNAPKTAVILLRDKDGHLNGVGILRCVLLQTWCGFHNPHSRMPQGCSLSGIAICTTGIIRARDHANCIIIEEIVLPLC